MSAGDGDDNFFMGSNLSMGDTLAGGDGFDYMEFTFSGDGNALSHVTGVEHIVLGDASANLMGHDNLADYLSTLILDASGMTGDHNLTWNGNFIANLHQDITGSDSGDSIRGGSNDDTLSGRGGEDTLEGNTGDDYIDGGANNEELRELDVASYVHESSGIIANLSTGTVTGGGGNDTLVNIEGVWGTHFDDSFTGDDSWVNIFIDGGGNDTINGGSTYDPVNDTGLDIAAYYDSAEGIHAEMHGSDGYVTVGDTLSTHTVDELHDIEMVWGSTQGDSLVGYEGDQQFMPDAGNDTVDGGTGDDDSAAYWNLTTAITVAENSDTTEGGMTVTGDGWEDTLFGIEWIEGTQGNDTFTGDGNDNSFSGWKGDDSIDGGSGGFNWATYGDDPSSNGGTRGIDAALDQGTVLDGWGNTDTVTNIQGIEGSAYDDTISGTGGSNYLKGDDGNDWIDGFGGLDTLEGGDGNDTISVQDTFSMGTVIRGGEGFDELQADVALTGVTEISGIEKLIVTSGSVVGLDGATANGLTWEVNASDSGGGTVVNVVATSAGQGIDISGWTYGEWNSSDQVNVSGFNFTGVGETLVGSSADEIIVGLAGNDSLTGGGGEDTFSYTSTTEVISQGTGGDVIADFVSGTDVVGFNALFGDLVWYEERQLRRQHHRGKQQRARPGLG